MWWKIKTNFPYQPFRFRIPSGRKRVCASDECFFRSRVFQFFYVHVCGNREMIQPAVWVYYYRAKFRVSVRAALGAKVWSFFLISTGTFRSCAAEQRFERSLLSCNHLWKSSRAPRVITLLVVLGAICFPGHCFFFGTQIPVCFPLALFQFRRTGKEQQRGSNCTETGYKLTLNDFSPTQVAGGVFEWICLGFQSKRSEKNPSQKQKVPHKNDCLLLFAVGHFSFLCSPEASHLIPLNPRNTKLHWLQSMVTLNHWIRAAGKTFDLLTSRHVWLG